MPALQGTAGRVLNRRRVASHRMFTFLFSLSFFLFTMDSRSSFCSCYSLHISLI